MGDKRVIYYYRFVIDGPRKRRVTTCSLCSAVVSDCTAHAVYHHNKEERCPDATSALLMYWGTYDSGRITIKLDYYGRVLGNDYIPTV